MMCLTALAMQAQLRVAILEPVDKAQNVSYAVKLMLRSSLTTAITNTPGYEGYDRVDMASITGEQEFQRTGNVSDDQIKQLGVATGAAYVLVTEAAKYDENNIIITAKILDVETFGIKKSSMQVSGISVDELQKSCNSLADVLLGSGQTAQTTAATPPKATPASQPQANTGASQDWDDIITFPDGTALYVTKSPMKNKNWGIPIDITQEEAVNNCACKGEGWRLPTTKELQALYEYRDNIGVNLVGDLDIYIVKRHGYSYWSQERGVTVRDGKVIDGLSYRQHKACYFCVKTKK